MADFFGVFIHLLWEVIFPILAVAAAGYLVSKYSKIDLQTLSKLQINLFVPIFTFVSVSKAELSWSQMGLIVGATLGAELLLAVPLFGFLHWKKVPPHTSTVLVISSVIFNSGNFGLPLAQLAFGNVGAQVQVLILLTANLSIWILGYLMMSSVTHGVSKALTSFVKTPMFVGIVAAVLYKAFPFTIPAPIHFSLDTISGGLIPLALVTLGAQLHQGFKKPDWKHLTPVLILKLFAMPAIMTLVVIVFHLWPWPGAMLIVAASAPTAVNTILLALELDGNSDLAADCVFWTTLLSAGTVAIVLALVKLAGGGPPLG